MVRPEIGARVSDQRLIARVIDGFDACDALSDFWIMALNMFRQLRFLIRWADDEDALRVSKRCRHFLQIGMILGRVSRSDGIRLAVYVLRWILGVNHQMLHARMIKVKDAGLAMINPNERMIVTGH